MDDDRDDPEEKVFPPKKVEEITGLSRSTIWREQKAGRFPGYLELSPGRVGAVSSEIRLWLKARRRRGSK